MLTGLLLLAVGATAWNSTQEVVVSSPPMEVRTGVPRSPEKAEEEALVQPVPRAAEERGMHQMKKTFKKMMPYLMIPTMMALGYAPFVLSSLKMLVMNALTMNMMALNAAIFMTLRNMAFGPRLGSHVKYYNFGYSNKKKPHHHHHHEPHHHIPLHHHPPHH